MQRIPCWNSSSPATKRKGRQMGLHKIKMFCTTKEMVSKLRPPTEWEKIFSGYTSDKVLITRIYRELQKTPPKSMNQ
jgi:hypothetical protein